MLITEDVDSDAWQTALAQVADLKSALSNYQLTTALAQSLAHRWGISVRSVWRRARAIHPEGCAA